MMDSVMDITNKIQELLDSSEICRQEAARVEKLRHKLEAQEMTVSVIGQFKRGKSTLVNAILQEKLLPVGIVPVTSVVTRIQYGEPSASVHFDNGIIQPIDLEQLPTYINEQENPGNRLCVSSVSLHTPAPFLEGGVTFVDTPGVGSAHQHNSDVAYAFVKESDAVIFMLSVDSPINQIEIDFLQNAREHAAKFYFAVNKIDQVDPEDLDAYIAYCRKLLCSLMEVDQVSLFPVSAKFGTGLAELTDRLQEDCQTSVREILEESAARKLKDILGSALSRLNLYWTALKMPIGKMDLRFRKMTEVLNQLQEQGRQAALNLDEAGDAGRYVDASNLLELELNRMKKQLSASAKELFGLEYHYELAELDLGEGYQQAASGDSLENLKNKFLSQVQQLCQEMESTLNLILMYREKNTITVARRMEDLNKLNRQLRDLKNRL
ncbi:hypothetical protein Ami103574_13050 [Aminipila butyrica]|uniref:Dynamin N-terminal domain-containing protein n=1 Tax=Aminipila butyrica TaxID=433296 RepID=A0A858BVS7_9FIRM|nr:dynamin family protein [Aminipila butyrica]QIB70161.1 hypothetical protein Ami103574_13050 [Aminipila butyrica]